MANAPDGFRTADGSRTADGPSPNGPTPARLAERRSSYPLVAVVHLSMVATLLCACLTPARLDPDGLPGGNAALGVVLVAILGALVGACVGLGAVRRAPAVLMGAAVGAPAALLAIGLVASGAPLRMLVVGVAILLAPMAIRAGHA